MLSARGYTGGRSRRYPVRTYTRNPTRLPGTQVAGGEFESRSGPGSNEATRSDSVAASSACASLRRQNPKGEPVLKLSRYSKIANEGIALKAEVGKKLRIGFDYAGVSRLSDRHQIEAWITALVRFCREATARELRLISVRVRQRSREAADCQRRPPSQQASKQILR
jgi:hypothetical protein